MNISYFCYIFFYLKIFGEIVTPYIIGQKLIK